MRRTRRLRSVIDAHFAESGVALYALYHSDAYQISICRGPLPDRGCNRHVPTSVTSRRIRDRLWGLNYRRIPRVGGDYPDFDGPCNSLFAQSPKSNLSLPQELLANLSAHWHPHSV